MTATKDTLPRATALRWLSLALLLVSFGVVGFVAWANLRAVAEALLARGWAPAVGADATLGMFLPRCLFFTACSDALFGAWQRRVPEALLYLPVLPLVGLAFARVLENRRGEYKAPGEARWATAHDLALYLGRTRKGPELVGYMGLHDGKHVVRLPEALRCAHTFIVGGTGAGKTTRYLNPNLLLDAKDGASAVVFDLKYPDPRSGFLEVINFFRAWGRRVYPFTPFDPDSARLPLLDGVNGVQDALEIAEIFRPGANEGSDAFYRNNERLLLAGLVLGVSRDPEPSLLQVYRLLGAGAAGLKEYAEARPAVQMLLGTLLSLKPDVIAGICTGLAGDLQIFLSPHLNRATSAGPGLRLDLKEVCRTSSLLYIGVPQEEIQGGKGQVLLRLIKRLLDRAILQVSGEQGGRLPVHLSVYFDEFPSFGPLPNINENLATMRSRRVAYHIAVQNRAQGEAIYGRDAFRAMINNNFGQMVIFPRSLRLEDAQYFAENFGEVTVWQETRGETRAGGLFGETSTSRRTQDVARQLLSAEAMRTFPDGHAVVELLGTPPAVVRVPRLDEADSPLRDVYARIRRRYAVPQLRRPGNAEPEGAPAEEVLAPLVIEKPAPARNPLAESFRSWLAKAIDDGAPCRVTFEGDDPVEARFARAFLREAPGDEAAWAEKGWVAPDGADVVLTRLGLSRVERLWKALRAHAPHERALRWAAEHADRVEGHPLGVAPPDPGAVAWTGKWTADTLYLPVELAVTLSGAASVELRQVEVGGRAQVLVPIVWNPRAAEPAPAG